MPQKIPTLNRKLSVIGLKIVGEVCVALYGKKIYRSTSVFLSLSVQSIFTIIYIFPILVYMYLNRDIRVKQNWYMIPDVESIVAYIPPTLCLSAALGLKKTVIKSDGPGISMLITSIQSPMSSILQYHYFGTITGFFGIISVGFCCLCYINSFFFVSSLTFLALATFGCAINVFRNILTKKSNKKVPLNELQALYVTSCISTFVYIIFHICTTFRNDDFRMYYVRSDFNFETGVFSAISMCGNLCTLWIITNCNQLSLINVAQAVSLVTIAFDLAGIDLILLTLLEVDPSSIAKMSNKVGAYANTKLIAFALKILSTVFYIWDRYNKINCIGTFAIKSDKEDDDQIKELSTDDELMITPPNNLKKTISFKLEIPNTDEIKKNVEKKYEDIISLKSSYGTNENV